ncbi:MAG: gliding motility-associated C-terminal domain-containing protein, partial [Saprospiraceae bacterium]
AGCDSTITLSLNVMGATYNPAEQTICQGERIFFGYRELRTAGRYLDTLTSVMTGCDSIVHLTLNVLDAPNESLTVDLCAGETFELNGEVYDRGGNYSQFFTAVNGCDSIVNLQINLTPNTTFAEQITICAGESYQVGNEVYNETGMYETVLSNAQNCDSLHQLSLFVLPSFSVELNTQICAGEAYLMGETEYTESGIYQQQFIAQNGCDSLVNLTLEVVDGYAIETQAAICAGESYEWNGETYTESGAYRDELTASSGCDSLIALVLEILPVYETTAEQQICAGESFDWEGETLTAAGEYTKTLTATTGCDSTVTLQLAITENVENQIFANICAGESYEWNGTTYGEAGTYEQTFTSAANCDSTVALMLFIIPEQRQRIDATTCEGHPYPFGDQMLWTPGLYTRTFTAASGCDSIVELFLAIERNTATIAQQTICEGEMVAFGTRELRIAGEYIDTLVAANGCDSFAVMQLSVLPAPNASESATICEGESYRFDGQELTESGTYERTVSADNGCNGVITLALEVLTNPETFLQQQICPDDSYFFNNEEVIERGIYEMVLPAANGCDSIVYLDLEILEDAVAILNPQICAGDSYRAGDTEFSESGTFTLNLTAANGCDSTLTINLAVLPNIINDMSVSICEGDSYQVGANEYSEAGVYRDTLSSENGCDSIVVLGLEVLPSPTVNDVQTICKGESYLLNGREYTVAGNYLERMETVAGCDSVVYLQLTVLPVEESYLPVTICAGETYALGNRIYDAAGTYMDTLTASTGCDSVILLEISELEVVYTAQQVSICTGENYIFNNETLTETGIYTQRYTAQNGCDSTVELTLEVFENIAINVNRTICAGEAIEIAGVAYSESGIYTNELQNINGCDSIVTLELRVLETETIREVVEMCAGSSYKFYGEEYTNSGTYEVRIPNENGCEDTAILVLTELPAINETVSATLCQGDTYRFGENELSTAGVYYDTLVSVNFCDSIVQLQLSVNEPTEQLLNLSICEGDSILIAGAYRMAADFFEENLITSYGCDSIVYTQLTVVPNIAIEAYGGEICAGDSIQIGVQGASEYEWFPKEGLSCTDCAEPMVAPTETTTYTVRVRGCLDEILEEQVTVVVKEASQLSITPAQEIVFGQSVTLEVFTDAFDPFIYWTIDDKIFCSECESITVSPQENVTYVVTVETEDGCVLQEEVDVTVRKNCIESDFFIPNMISPNGDGANDEFYIETDIPSNLKHLRIYDRWGEMMFETDDWETHWNGNFRGKAVNPGVYVYYLEAVCPNNEPFKKVGNITVLK